MSPEPVPEGDLEGRGTLEGSCEVEAGCSWGMEAEERARWIAAADGIVVLGPGRLGPRLGLASELFRERAPVGGAVDAVFWRWDGRAGEDSRLELAVEGVERFSERGTPFRADCWRRVGPLSELWVGVWERIGG